MLLHVTAGGNLLDPFFPFYNGIFFFIKARDNVPIARPCPRWRSTLLPPLNTYLPNSPPNQRMKHQADKKRQECQFEVGDWVYIKLQPYA